MPEVSKLDQEEPGKVLHEGSDRIVEVQVRGEGRDWGKGPLKCPPNTNCPVPGPSLLRDFLNPIPST